jgi:amino acid transporter
VQQALIAVELGILGLLAVVALIKVYGGSAGPQAIHPSLGWVNPFALSPGTLADGILLGVFVYWGWDACVTVNEESQDSRNGPGKAAVVSTLILLVTFVLVATAGQSVAGPGFLANHSTDVLSALGGRVLGGTLDKLLILVVLTSTAACTQTSIMPTARTMLSMARWDAAPAVFGRIHPRFQTPGVATIVMGVASTVWTVALLVANPAQSVLGDSITALGFDIAFYYGMTGLACVVYYRRWLGRGLQQLVTLGLVPLLGALSLAAIFVKALGHYSQHTIDGFPVNYAAPVFGVEVPIVIGIGSLVLGLVLAFALRPIYRSFFARRLEVLDPSDILDQQTVA